MKERIVRELHSPSWKNGTPATDQRGSGAIKYIRLESYEDATFNWLLGGEYVSTDKVAYDAVAGRLRTPQ